MRNKFKLASAFTLLSSVVVGLLVAAGTGSSAARQDQPTVAKDSVQMGAFTYNVYKKNYDVWSWVPQVSFRVNGPSPAGASSTSSTRCRARRP